MRRLARSLVSPASLAAALALTLAAPGAAQDLRGFPTAPQIAPSPQADAARAEADQPTPQAARAAALADVDLLILPAWRRSDRYEGFGFGARALMGARVIDADGERAGSVETLILDAQGRVLSIVVAVGGTLGFGRTLANVPMSSVTIAGDLSSVEIPVRTADIEAATEMTRPMLTARVAASEIVPVDAQGWNGAVLPGAGAWSLADLVGDTIPVAVGLPHALVGDAVIDESGRLVALVVTAGAGAGYGVLGPRDYFAHDDARPVERFRVDPEAGRR